MQNAECVYEYLNPQLYTKVALVAHYMIHHNIAKTTIDVNDEEPVSRDS